MDGWIEQYVGKENTVNYYRTWVLNIGVLY